jgi:hypothetical protein
MAWHLFVVTLGVEFAHARSARQAANTIAAQNACNACVGDSDVVITRQVPNDPDRAEVVFASQVKDLVDDLWRRLVSRIFRNRLFVDQPGFAALVGFAYITDLLSIAQHLELALNISFFLGHRIHPSGCLSAI